MDYKSLSRYPFTKNFYYGGTKSSILKVMIILLLWVELVHWSLLTRSCADLHRALMNWSNSIYPVVGEMKDILGVSNQLHKAGIWCSGQNATLDAHVSPQST